MGGLSSLWCNIPWNGSIITGSFYEVRKFISACKRAAVAFRGTEKQEAVSKRAWAFEASFFPGLAGRGFAQGKESAASSIERSSGYFPWHQFWGEQNPSAFLLIAMASCAPPNLTRPLSWPYFRLILLVSLVIKLIFLLNLCEFLPMHGRAHPK